MTKRAVPVIITALLFIGAAFGLSSRPAAAGRLMQDGLPIYGWQVCRDNGLQTIPGLGQRQVFDLCNGAGYRISAYCLDPGDEPPSVGAMCQQTETGIYWCGDAVQSLHFLGLLESPGEVTETATATSTTTGTPTPTATATATATSTATATGTATATATETMTMTPGGQILTLTATPSETGFPNRPRPGGPGNGGPLAAAALGLGAVFTGLIWAFLRRRAG